ncbi:hypothetical protein PR003_g13566 [Phytophthora rubi]|uniref:Uncharacterized protein n=1 Tax=Phytophthora rubi TaxID=129364 RepID=A0A6A3LXS2_9STRA|nr:hypothetical protein PR001_g13030 [Phytophthora rubi]KAE9334344.1 hypothetical protein PR003_g13566 [Phytophthora rubi]
MRFDAVDSIAFDGTLYTESNGLKFVEHVCNHQDMDTFAIIREKTSVHHHLHLAVYQTRRPLCMVCHQVQLPLLVHDIRASCDGEVVHRHTLLVVVQRQVPRMGEHLNEMESVHDSVAKKHITKGMEMRGNFFINVGSANDGMRSLLSKIESQFFRPLTV